MRRVLFLGALLMTGGLSIMVCAPLQAPAGQRGGPNVADIEKIKDNLYVITGGGGNTAAFITDKGVVLVDTKLTGWGQAILDKIKTITDKPVTTIIITHGHADHFGSNQDFPVTVDIIAHEQSKSHMETLPAFQADKAKFLPKRTFKDKMTIGTGKDRIELYFFGRGHTDGDVWVLFPEARVLHAGDMFAVLSVPRIDAMTGSAVEYGKTLQKAYEAAGTRVDTIITGHAALVKPAVLKEYAAFNNEFITWVQEEIKAGKTVDQATAEWKLPAKYSSFAGGPGNVLDRVKNNIQVAYNELKK